MVILHTGSSLNLSIGIMCIIVFVNLFCFCLFRLFFLKNAEELLVDGEYVRHTPAPRCRSRSGS